MPSPAHQFSLSDWLAGLLPDVTLWVKLYQGNPTFVLGGIVPVFLEADFDGYYAQRFDIYFDAFKAGDTLWTAQSRIMSFIRSTDGGSQNVIGGYCVIARYPDGTETLVAFEAFRTPQLIEKLDDSVCINVTLRAMAGVVS